MPPSDLRRLLAKKVDPLNKPASRRYVKRQIRHSTETQFDYTTSTTQNIAFDGPEVVSMTTPSSALGDKINLKGLKVRAKLSNPADVGAVHCRIIVFQWFQDDAVSSPTMGVVLQDATGADSIISGYNITRRDNTVNFKILKDVYVRLGEAGSLEGQNSKIVQFYIPMKSLQRKVMRMTGNGTGFNGIYYLAYSDVADASSPPTLELQSVLTFTDES